MRIATSLYGCTYNILVDLPTSACGGAPAKNVSGVHQSRFAHATTFIFERTRFFVLVGFDTHYNNLTFNKIASSATTKISTCQTVHSVYVSAAKSGRGFYTKPKDYVYNLDKKKIFNVTSTHRSFCVSIWYEQTRRPLPRASISDLDKAKLLAETKSIPMCSKLEATYTTVIKYTCT